MPKANNYGFQFRRLRFEGPGKQAAEVAFRGGLNVISGASETGKSYVLRCLDFMLGASKPPKHIEAAAGYERVLLDIESRSGETFRLVRALDGGDFLLVSNSNKPTVLSAKHAKGKKNTVSHFLLSLSGLADKRISKSKSTPPGELSFREVVDFLIVDEVSIIAEHSPVHHGQYIHRCP